MKYLSIILIFLSFSAVAKRHQYLVYIDYGTEKRLLKFGPNGKHFDPSKVIHDERKNGPMPQKYIDADNLRLKAIQDKIDLKDTKKKSLLKKIESETYTQEDLRNAIVWLMK